MKISLRSEYALLSLVYIARQPDASSAEVGTAQQIPPEALREVLTVLIDAKYLRLTKGTLRLSKPAERISIIDIIRLFDGVLALMEPVSEKGYLPAPMEKEKKLTEFFTQLQAQIVIQLERTSLAEMV
jgi:Rrf2 family protein